MTHPLAGHLEVDESAKTVRHYRYAVERMMRILGGWIALTPELSAKLLMGRHVWDCAQHADAWGKRLPELRAAAQVSEPPNARLVAFMDALEAAETPEQTIERVVGVYRVLKPHLLATYEAHLARANAVYEPPDQAHRLVFVEEWADEQALRAHFAVPASVDFANEMGRLAATRTQLRLYQATEMPFPGSARS